MLEQLVKVSVEGAVFVSHDLEEALLLSDRVVVMTTTGTLQRDRRCPVPAAAW